MNRRKFLRDTQKISLGFLSLHAFVNACTSGTGHNSETHRIAHPDRYLLHPGYGPLKEDPKGIMNLPDGFTYEIISRQGDKMIDGFLVPGAADGMATFGAPDNKVLIIRNHELSPGNAAKGPFGKDMALLSKLPKDKIYDYGRGIKTCMGGTTTMLYNPATGKVEQEYLSLAGTIRNCAGGTTPWNSWLSCEENTATADDELEKDHGYVFEVPAQVTPKLFDPVPIKAMGRFNHEAVCVDPKTGIVYQTEDRKDGLFYRYLPKKSGQLHAGGKLQVLAIKGKKRFDTRNWSGLESEPMIIGQKYEVEWLDIDGIQAPDDDLRHRGFENGAARFARGEGIWFGNNEAYFACTDGGYLEHGQIFRYTPSPKEGKRGEKNQAATLELFVEPNNIELVESCDNVTIAPNGDLLICEDLSKPRIVGITPEGQIYHLAKNIGYKAEFAGACFSPDGKTCFVNIQGPGLTLAINGPWGSRKS